MTKEMTRAKARRIRLSHYSDAELFNELHDRDTIAVVQLGADDLCKKDRELFRQQCTWIQRDMEKLCWPLLGESHFTLAGGCDCVPECPQ